MCRAFPTLRRGASATTGAAQNVAMFANLVPQPSQSYAIESKKAMKLFSPTQGMLLHADRLHARVGARTPCGGGTPFEAEQKRRPMNKSRGYSRSLLTDLITPELILPSLQASNKRRVIEKLSCFAAWRAGLNEEVVKKAVLSRGDLTTFGVGRGLAIPHATVPGILQPLAAFARLKRPVQFGAADGRPADLVLLLLAPEGDDGILLRALSCTARRLRDREVADNLRAATSGEASYIILTSDAWRRRDLVA